MFEMLQLLTIPLFWKEVKMARKNCSKKREQNRMATGHAKRWEMRYAAFPTVFRNVVQFGAFHT